MTPPALRARPFVWPPGASRRALADEVARLTDDDFLAYPAGGLGTAAVPLVAPGGAPSHDFAIAGPAAATAALARSPRLAQVIGALGVRVARSRLIRLAAHTTAAVERGETYHAYRHPTIAIAIVTDPAVRLLCDEHATHLAADRAWSIARARPFALDNRAAHACVHLVVETVAETTDAARPADGALALAPYQFTVLTPDEIAGLVAVIVADAPELPAAAQRLLHELAARWTAAFARFGHASRGELAYQDLVLDVRERVVPYLAPGSPAARAAAVIDTMLHVAPPVPRRLSRAAAAARRSSSTAVEPPVFDRPVFVVSAPRAGSTMLFDLLARLPGAATLGGENHEILRAIPALHPAARDHASDRLTAADATPEAAAAVRAGFARRLIDRDGRRFADLPAADRPRAVRLVEKTPANALRIPFLRQVFPDARFVHLTREPRGNIASLIEGWRSRHFVAYRELPGWPHRDWSFLLVPGWRSLADRSLIEIASQQWQIANATIAHDLGDVPASARCTVDYDDLVRAPARVVRAIAALADLAWDGALDAQLASALPLSRVTLSAPAAHKWWRHEAELLTVLTDPAPDTVSHRRSAPSPSEREP